MEEQNRIDIGKLFFITEDGKDHLSADFNWYVDLTDVEKTLLEHHLQAIQDVLISSLKRIEEEIEEGEQE